METGRVYELKIPGKEGTIKYATEFSDNSLSVKVEGITSACVMRVLVALEELGEEEENLPDNSGLFPVGFQPEEVVISVSAPAIQGAPKRLIYFSTLHRASEINFVIQSVIDGLGHTLTKKGFPEGDHEVIAVFTPEKKKGGKPFLL